MIFFLIIVIIAVIAYFYFCTPDNQSQTIVNKSEIIKCTDFQEALERAKIIKNTFQEATKNCDGFLRITTENTDISCIYHPSYYTNDNHNPFIYFGLYLREVGTYPIQAITESSDEVTKKALISIYIKEVFGKSIEEMTELGLDVEYIVYNTKIKDICETVLFYEFPCPCGLKGDDRVIFIREVDKL